MTDRGTLLANAERNNPAPGPDPRQDAMPTDRPSLLEPGAWVCHPDRPDWGPGQVQSVIGARVTVNFRDAGKVLINAAAVTLEDCPDPDAV
jgi:hypothetical protein